MPCHCGWIRRGLETGIIRRVKWQVHCLRSIDGGVWNQVELPSTHIRQSNSRNESPIRMNSGLSRAPIIRQSYLRITTSEFHSFGIFRFFRLSSFPCRVFRGPPLSQRIPSVLWLWLRRAVCFVVLTPETGMNVTKKNDPGSRTTKKVGSGELPLKKRPATRIKVSPKTIQQIRITRKGRHSAQFNPLLDFPLDKTLSSRPIPRSMEWFFLLSSV